MVKVFLSHCSDDLSLFDEIIGKLSIREIEWYIAERDPDTRALSQKVIQHLNESDLVVLLLTPKAKVSEYVNQEIGYAVKATKRIDIIRVGDATPGGLLSGHEYTKYDDSDIDGSIKRIEEHLNGTIKRALAEQIILGEGLIEVKKYHDDVAYRIKATNQRFGTKDRQRIVLHLFPYNYPQRLKDYDVQSDVIKDGLAPLFSSSWTPRILSTGLVARSPDNAEDGTPASYANITKDGVVEAIDGRLFTCMRRFVGPEDPYILSIKDIADTVTQKVASYAKLLEAIGVPFPLTVYITLLDVKGYKAVELRYDAHRTPIEEDDLHFGPCVIQSSMGIKEALRPAFDTLAQACGMSDASFLDKK